MNGESARHHNPAPDMRFGTINDLRLEMTRLNEAGDGFLDYLLAGHYSEGKGVWINGGGAARQFYDALLAVNPHLACESPFGTYFRHDSVRERGENRILIRGLTSAPPQHKAIIETHRQRRMSGEAASIAVFSGGPAAKVSALLCTLPAMREKVALEISFILDGAEQSNESGSASYEHVNHANALNAERDNTGFGILKSAVLRALLGEPDPSVALSMNYAKVDLWPRAVTLRDIPVFLLNELHGLLQILRHHLNAVDDHTRSRLASKKSTEILTFIERELGIALRLDNQRKRAIFLYFTKKHFALSLRDNAELRASVGLQPIALSAAALTEFYGASILKRIVAADLFSENACINHGLDEICRSELVKQGVSYLHRRRIAEIYFEEGSNGDPCRAAGIVIQDVASGEETCLPVDYLGLSLGPTATYHFERATNFMDRWCDRFDVGMAVPYQTIATGISAQVLFRIVDQDLARCIPFSGMKQTHFVEMGRTASHVLMKLTCGGTIGLPVYSRSYGISALASILRVITPDMGLQFEDVICAWPCSRGINPSNNGQIVRLADNAVCRFGEGGTGMSKMGSNAQTMLDLLGLPWPAPQDLRMPDDLFRHTIVDKRNRVARRLARQR
ncbi:MAG TPA: hypothetical protein VM144_11520 [Aestuariivirga sp.]|nr:hypothetical protein [Aestuariivirga sp.]